MNQISRQSQDGARRRDTPTFGGARYAQVDTADGKGLPRRKRGDALSPVATSYPSAMFLKLQGGRRRRASCHRRYERCRSCSWAQATSHLRARDARIPADERLESRASR
jgi:hypothetical protein